MGLHTTSRKRQNFKGGKVRLFEHIDLKVLSPGQTFDKLWRVIHKRLVLRAQLLVHNGRKA